MLTLQIATVVLAAIAMSLALAHALEFPGKMRLNPQTYLTVQTIYYPGFTIAGAAEPLAALASLALLLLMRGRGASFWWILAAFLALIAMHAVFWFVTQPANRFWLKSQQLSKSGAKFFGLSSSSMSASTDRERADWKHFRNQWEYSHIARAVLSLMAFIALVSAMAISH